MIQTNLASLRTPAALEHKTEYAENGAPVLSPSQLSTYLMCPRKWAARYIHGQHEAPNASAAAGKRMHKLLEHYYNDKKHPVPTNQTPEGTWALALMAKTALPLPGLPHAESSFKFEHESVWWRGSKDLVYQDGEVRVVRDHKSTSQLNPLWMKGEDELRTDPQSVIYAFEEYLSADAAAVRNEWGYVTRDKYPQCHLTVVEMSWDITWAGMQTHTATGKRMLELYREKPTLNSLPPTGASNGGCEAYGGCEVQGCNVTALDRIKGLQVFNAKKKETTDMSTFLEQLAAKQAAKALIGTTSEPEAAPAPTAAPVPTVRERLAAAETQTSAGEGYASVPPAAMGVNPPSYTPPPAPAAAPPAGVPLGANPAPAPRRGRQRAAAPATVVVPTKDIAAAEAGVGALLGNPTVKPYQAAIAAAGIDGYVLCINCFPVAQDVTMFSRYAAAVHAALKDTKGWDLYTIAQFEGAANYHAALQHYLEQSPPSGYLVVDARTTEGRDALPILERGATAIIRGF